uniref:Uncharacterized protein n=1 Tax=Tanacetum cinerariifolium TaxID=118510 RepID=A0A6L2KWR4_TANCI|nr:hypothetical protein [Tanacetum cinerariifolium]
MWEVNGDFVSSVVSASSEAHIPPKTAEQRLARKNELKAKSTLMLAIPDEQLLKFHACKDAKSLWEAIKNRLPLAWNNIALIMRNKSDLDTLSMDDLYNNLKFKTSSTNETVNTAHSVFAASSKDQASTASYANDVMFSFFSNQSNASQLDNEDLEHIDTDDLKEMDLKWQVAMLTMRVKRRGHFAREFRAPSNQGNRNRDAPTRNAPLDTSTINALVVQDGIGGYDWRFQAEEKLTNFALMAHTSSLSRSDSELENAFKEKDDLKLKLEKFKTSSKNLTKLIDSQISATNKTGLGYDGYVNESEVLNNVVESCESDGDDNQVNDMFKKASSVSTARHVNTATSRPHVNIALPITYSYFKAHSPVKRSFNQKSAAKTNSFNERVNTAKVNNVTTVGPKVVVSAAEGKWNNAVKSSAC